MANTDSTVVTTHTAAQTAGRSPLDPLDSGAVLMFIRSRVTCPATPTPSDTLTLVPGELIPAGARYAPENSWVYPVTDPGTALNLDVERLDVVAGAIKSVAVRARPTGFCNRFDPEKPEVLKADHVVVACGAYSAPLLRTVGVDLPI